MSNTSGIWCLIPCEPEEPEEQSSLWTQRSWNEAGQGKECPACGQKGAPANMQLLLLSVKPCQKSIALKTRGQSHFPLNTCDISDPTTPKEELWWLKGSDAVAQMDWGTVGGCNPRPAAGMLPAWGCSCCAAPPLPPLLLRVHVPLMLQQRQKIFYLSCVGQHNSCTHLFPVH